MNPWEEGKSEAKKSGLENVLLGLLMGFWVHWPSIWDCLKTCDSWIMKVEKVLTYIAFTLGFSAPGLLVFKVFKNLINDVSVKLTGLPMHMNERMESIIQTVVSFGGQYGISEIWDWAKDSTICLQNNDCDGDFLIAIINLKHENCGDENENSETRYCHRIWNESPLLVITSLALTLYVVAKYETDSGDDDAQDNKDQGDESGNSKTPSGDNGPIQNSSSDPTATSTEPNPPSDPNNTGPNPPPGNPTPIESGPSSDPNTSGSDPPPSKPNPTEEPKPSNDPNTPSPNPSPSYPEPEPSSRSERSSSEPSEGPRDPNSKPSNYPNDNSPDPNNHPQNPIPSDPSPPSQPLKLPDKIGGLPRVQLLETYCPSCKKDKHIPYEDPSPMFCKHCSNGRAGGPGSHDQLSTPSTQLQSNSHLTFNLNCSTIRSKSTKNQCQSQDTNISYNSYSSKDDLANPLSSSNDKSSCSPSSSHDDTTKQSSPSNASSPKDNDDDPLIKPVSTNVPSNCPNDHEKTCDTKNTKKANNGGDDGDPISKIISQAVKRHINELIGMVAKGVCAECQDRLDQLVICANARGHSQSDDEHNDEHQPPDKKSRPNLCPYCNHPHDNKKSY